MFTFAPKHTPRTQPSLQSALVKQIMLKCTHCTREKECVQVCSLLGFPVLRVFFDSSPKTSSRFASSHTMWILTKSHVLSLSPPHLIRCVGVACLQQWYVLERCDGRVD